MTVRHVHSPMPAPLEDSTAVHAIDRWRDDWDNLYYRCRVCSAETGSVASLTHDSDCPVQNPDGGEMVFEENTEELIRMLVDEAMWLTEDGKTMDSVEQELGDRNGVRWTASQSTSRFVLGLGRTSPHGQFHLDDHRGIVLKLDPRVRTDEDYTPVSGNLDELFTWEKALETETDQFFGDVLACARDGAWLVMEACIPIEMKRTSEMNHRDMLYDRGGNEYIGKLLGVLQQHGWVGSDYKHGNVGLTDDGVPVLIDYGTGPEYNPDKADTDVIP